MSERMITQVETFDQVNPWAAKLEVLDIRPVTGEGNLRAYVTVKLGRTLIVYGCRIVKEPGKRAWVSFPQVRNNDRWYAVVRSEDPRLREALTAAVLAAWDREGAT